MTGRRRIRREGFIAQAVRATGRLGAVFATIAALAPGARAEVAAPETTEVFVAVETASTPVVRMLAHRFLLIGSERVLRAGAVLRPEVDYRLDADAGTLRLATPLASGESLDVTYSWVPLNLPRDFVALVRGEATPADSTRMRDLEEASLSSADRFGRTVGEDLVIGGAKTLSIDVGNNQDAKVEQSLRVSVTGRIGEDVRLTALLSDQNIPLQPEGNTQRLEELDEVLIRVEGPRGEATLGDFVATRTGTAFGNFDRRLSGGEARVLVGAGGVRAIGASTRGDFATVEFYGEEGRQGPYVLAGDGLNPAGVIVAGSERVWMDGRPLQRGEVRDYVIDYSRGELEFTNRVLITGDSEIAVDFEVAEQEYKRSFVMGETTFASAGERVQGRASVLSEIDGDDPLNVVLDDARRDALEAAGDASVLVSGAVCDLEDGDYIEVDGHFEYAGADSGTCDVSFTFVGDVMGDYLRDRDLDTGLTFFRFVGAGLGDYTPGLRLAAPRTVTLADLTVGVNLGELSLTADGAFSRDDRNTFSDLDDGDNDGAAGRAELAWKSGELARAGGSVTLETRATYRGESAQFAPVGRTRDAYLGERWNFVDTERADESNGEVEARLGAGDRWSVDGSWGFLERVGRFRSTRSAGTVRGSTARFPTARVHVESVRREDSVIGDIVGDLDRQSAELGATLAFLRPGVSFWREDRTDARADSLISGSEQVEWKGKLGISAGRTAHADFVVSRRTTDVVNSGAWERQSEGRTVEVRAEANPNRNARVRLSWIRRVLDFTEGTDRTTNLTRADLTHEMAEGLITAEYFYETTSRVFTGDAADPEAVEEPTLALEASARIRTGGRRRRGARSADPSQWRRWLERIRTETLLRVEEETRTSDRGPIYRLDFSRFQSDEHTVFGKILWREEITLFPGAGPFSLTARWERIDTKDNRVQSRSTDILSERRVLRARNRLDRRWTLETQGTWQDDSRGDSSIDKSEFDIRMLELREELVWQPNPTTRIGGSGALVSERNDVNGASIRGVTLGLTSSAAVRSTGRFRGALTWTHPTEQEGVDTAGRFRTKEGDELEWRGTLDLRMSGSINASLSYSGRKQDGLNAIHRARAEMRALF